ncbi:hypothetical protein VO54_03672 [Elizabethkingia miricola]|nr:hypothetical protein VO54_03672 [Elizabethkingia miricola]
MGTERFLILSFSISIFSALSCIVLLLIKIAKESLNKFMKRFILLLIFAYTIEIVYMLSLFFYHFNIALFMPFKAVNFFAALLFPILFYHFIFKLTRLKTHEYFKPWHYAAPLILALLFYLLFARTPKELINHSDYKSLTLIKGHEIYSIFNYGRFYIEVVFSIIYIYLSAKRITHYRNEIVQYSSNIERSSLAWVYQVFGITILVFVFPIVYYFTTPEIHFKFISFLIPNILVLIFNVVICYNVFQQNFILLTEDIVLDKLSDLTSPGKDQLTHKKVYNYMINKKPYLDPYLKITDLAPMFATNRSYLSSFINTTYGLNFSMYINRFRLEEFYRLKNLPENKNLELDELVYLSGFRSLQSLKRSEKILLTLKKMPAIKL